MNNTHPTKQEIHTFIDDFLARGNNPVRNDIPRILRANFALPWSLAHEHWMEYQNEN